MPIRTLTRRTSALLLAAVLVICLCGAGCQTTARGQYDIAVGGSGTK